MPENLYSANFFLNLPQYTRTSKLNQKQYNCTTLATLCWVNGHCYLTEQVDWTLNDNTKRVIVFNSKYCYFSLDFWSGKFYIYIYIYSSKASIQKSKKGKDGFFFLIKKNDKDIKKIKRSQNLGWGGAFCLFFIMKIPKQRFHKHG